MSDKMFEIHKPGWEQRRALRAVNDRRRASKALDGITGPIVDTELVDDTDAIPVLAYGVMSWEQRERAA